MESLFANLLGEFSTAKLLIIALVVLVTSAIHGATGVAGGFLMSAALAPIVGVKAVVPVISVSLLISHSARALLNFRDFDRKVFRMITLTAVPCIMLGAIIYGRLSSPVIALVLGCVILASVPVRRWAKNHRIKTSDKQLYAASLVYGGLSGVSIGPGMLLVPFMLGYGISKESFVATLAAVALVTNITRVAVYGGSNLLDQQSLFLGVLVGLITIPGNWVGRSLLRRMSQGNHSTFVDILAIIGALNFFWLGWSSL